SSERSDQQEDPRTGKPRLFYAQDFPTPESVSLETIAVVRSPYMERFGTPRQATVTNGVLNGTALPGQIVFNENRNFEVALRDLDGFELCWVISYLHLNK
ncbi:unnamed protein product, partial [Phaeothamnion confervicola]